MGLAFGSTKGGERGEEGAFAGEEEGEEWEGWGATSLALPSSSLRLTVQRLPLVCCPGILIMSQESGSGQ